MKEIQKRLSKSFFILLSLPATAMGFGLSVQIAALSWILDYKYGFKIHDIAIVWAAGPIAGILGQIIIGLISDKVWFWGGRRKPFIIIGGILAALMLFCLPRLDLIDQALGVGDILSIAIVVALTLDLSINVGFNPTRSIIADVTPEGKHRTRGFTWMQAISNFFGAGAYLISALTNNYILIYVGIALILAFTIIPVFFIEEPKNIDLGENESEKVGFAEILKTLTPLSGYLFLALYGIGVKLEYFPDNRTIFYVLIILGALMMLSTMIAKEKGVSTSLANERSFRKLLTAHSFTWIGVQTMFIYSLFFIKQHIYPVSEYPDGILAGRMIGWAFFLLNGFGFIFPIILLEPMSKKLGRVKTHILAISLMALGYFGIAFLGTQKMTFLIFMAILSIGWSSLVSLPFVVMTEKVSKSKMGLYMGIFNLSVVLPQLVASFIIGKEIELALNKNLIFIISGASLAISAILWIFVTEKNPASNDE